ncbi:PulJ/GspJ family protein [Thiohalobacter thiocyanaticus]|uniref:Type II secretion system protein n=1 Tax=Thiohalobacter thiocyanaticus TaxID=585455 RepID=A0A426QJX1_9GAMM|nr:type II secretion system protein [Thiohalobacter thiocyanaticus]RRQ21997.1 type II secretion system protein [Thiohalobacter thiocyanaticus]
MRPSITHPRRSHGFSLIEMVVTIMILSILGGVTAYTISHGAQAYLGSRDIVTTLSKLRLASERLAREIRSVRRDPAAPAQYDFNGFPTASNLSFDRLEADGVTVTTVSIDGSGNPITLEYDTPGGAHTLTDQVASFALAYYQADGVTAATSTSDIAFVEFELVLQDANGNSYPQRTRVALRQQE